MHRFHLPYHLIVDEGIFGKIPQVMSDVLDNPELINNDPYANWILKIEMSDASELEKLLDATKYQSICK